MYNPLDLDNKNITNIFSSALLEDSPIFINGNEELASFCTIGNGSSDNPYIIENYSINAAESDGIRIQNVNLYLIIRNCIIENGSVNYHCGIKLESCAHITIMNNTLLYNQYGIFLYSSYNNTIINNIAKFNFFEGITIDETSNSNNIINNTIVKNDHYGIFIHKSSFNFVKDNLCRNNGFDGISLIESSNSNYFLSNIIEDNKHNGIYIYTSCINNTFFGITIKNNTWEGIYIGLQCNQNTIKKNLITNNIGRGIKIENNSSSNLIVDNIIKKNNREGVLVDNSDSNIIENNTICEQINGLNLITSSATIIHSNFLDDNRYGIYIDHASGNIIWENYLINNFEANAYSTSTSFNHWDNETIGNYWGNYYSLYPNASNNGKIWDTPFAIKGSVNDFDKFPLVLPAPNSPILQKIEPNLSQDGKITLNWNKIPNAKKYRIYCSSLFIISVSNLSPIATTGSIFYTDNRIINGTYFYVITAINGSGESDISNCESIQVAIPPVTSDSEGSNPFDNLDLTSFYIPGFSVELIILCSIISMIGIIMIITKKFLITS